MLSTRRSRKQHERPTFLVDRTFGYEVARTLRNLGYKTHMLAEVYGKKKAPKVQDPQWIRRSAAEGWIGVTRDELRPWRGLIVRVHARIFRIGRVAETAEQQSAWLTMNINRMVQRANHRGPWMFIVRERSLEPVELPERHGRHG